MAEYTSIDVRYRAWPAVPRPYRVTLVGDPVWATDRRGRRLYMESQPEKLITACRTPEAANAAAHRASAKHRLPYTPWTGDLT